MTVGNPSFETQAASPSSPGRPADWTVNTVGGALDWAVFPEPPPAAPIEGEAHETFEVGWPVYEDQFVGSLTTGDDPNAVLAVFDVGPAERKYEDFESGWAAGQYLPEMPGATAAIFDSNPYESFAWPPIKLVYHPNDLPSELTFVSFDGFIKADGFSQGWRNDTWYDGGTTPDWMSDPARFVIGGLLGYYEPFSPAPNPRLIVDINFNDDLLVLESAGFGIGQRLIVEPGGDNTWPPTPLSYGVDYYVVDDQGPSIGLAIGEGGTKIALTGIGSGENYLVESRRDRWVTSIEI